MNNPLNKIQSSTKSTSHFSPKNPHINVYFMYTYALDNTYKRFKNSDVRTIIKLIDG